jgi:hypothetical protein
MAAVILLDLNGTHYMGLQEGETLVANPLTTYHFPAGTPYANAERELVVFNQDQAMLFIRRNAHAIAAAALAANMQINANEVIHLAYLRLLCVRHGLVSPAFLPNNFHVDYTEAVIDAAPGGLVPEPNVTAALTAENLRALSKNFYDRVGLCAFVFRTRGHHYVDNAGYEELIKRVWQKCRYSEAELVVHAKAMMTIAFHAIFPQILDNFWTAEVREHRINGALVKRLDSACAGTAGIHVLWQGIRDLTMVAPGIKDRLAAAERYLEQAKIVLDRHRYNGSVNARYYGAERIQFDEREVAAIAATIRAALESLADQAPLLRSAALQRIANQAPITGAVFARAIGKIPEREEVVNRLLIESGAEETKG